MDMTLRTVATPVPPEIIDPLVHQARPSWLGAPSMPPLRGAQPDAPRIFSADPEPEDAPPGRQGGPARASGGKLKKAKSGSAKRKLARAPSEKAERGPTSSEQKPQNALPDRRGQGPNTDAAPVARGDPGTEAGRGGRGGNKGKGKGKAKAGIRQRISKMFARGPPSGPA